MQLFFLHVISYVLNRLGGILGKSSKKAIDGHNSALGDPKLFRLVQQRSELIISFKSSDIKK